MNAVAWLMILLLAGIPPLTPDERGLLETAYDGRTHEEPAFRGLLSNTARWTGDVGDAPIRLEPNFAALLERPDEFRGALCLIDGRIEQIETLRPPYENVHAWFIREANSRPVIVYVDFRTAPSEQVGRFRPGSRAAIAARFYKRIDAEDQRGREQAYAAFVGAHPELLAPDHVGLSAAALMAGLVGLLGVAFIVIWIIARRAARRPVSAPVHTIDEDSEPHDDLELPDDPAQALAVLRDAAEGPD